MANERTFEDTADANQVPDASRQGLFDSTCLARMRANSARYPLSAKRVRDTFKDYFLSPEGCVTWQTEHVRADGNLH